MKRLILASLIASLPQAYAAGTFTPTLSGTLKNQSLSVAITPDSTVSGKSGRFYVVLNLNGSWFVRTSAGWSAWTFGTTPAAFSEGTLTAQTLTILSGDVDLRGYVGAQIFVGYGTDSQDMLTNTRYAKVFTAQPSQLLVVSKKTYDGVTDDLLTAGLGSIGIGSSTSPAAKSGFSATNPADLRRLAIWANYRAVIDPSAVGGFGTLYGPNLALSGSGAFNAADGKIAGDEYLGLADPGDGSEMVELMVQIPAHFDVTKPCIVTGPSSGSRGVYGAIGTSGEWGLKRGCAVAYADVGKGNGFHDLSSGKVTLSDGNQHGVRVAAFDGAGYQVVPYPHFLAKDEKGQIITPSHSYNTLYPNMHATKQFHSQLNPESKWGSYTLSSIKLALALINEKYAPANTTSFVAKGKETTGQTGVIVITSSVSNGGGASLHAAEEDTDGLITGVVVHEPNIWPDLSKATISIKQGSNTWSGSGLGKQLADFISVLSLYQPCASLARTSALSYNAMNTLNQQSNRCRSLAKNGLLPGMTDVDITSTTAVTAAAVAAQKKITDYGVLDSTLDLAPQYDAGFNYVGIMPYYSASYGRFAVTENLCGWGTAVTGTTGAITAAPAAADALMFGTGNGLAGWGVLPVYLASTTSAKSWTLATSASSGTQDLAFDGTLCAHKMFTGIDPATGSALSGTDATNAQRVRTGMNELKASGNLRGKPAIIMHGAADALVAPNHTSRAYFGLNKSVEGSGSKLVYLEIQNGHHLEAFNQLPGFSTKVVPAHAYFPQALNAMWDYLTTGKALPTSQLVRTTARTVATDTVTTTNVPALSATPDTANQITYSSGVVTVPQ